jgi:hypothetical protein
MEHKKDQVETTWINKPRPRSRHKLDRNDMDSEITIGRSKRESGRD